MAFLLALVATGVAFAKDPPIGPNEVELGKEAQAAVAKDNKFVDDAAMIKRVRDIGEQLVKIANEKQVTATYGTDKVTPFEYTFDVIENEDVNAFSTPGGHIYVHTGLLKFVQSDHELAAVLAHEVAHASHHHMVYLIKKQEGLGNAAAIAILAAMLSGARGSDVSNVLLGVNLYQIAKLNGYSMDAERDSDHAAILYMKETPYNAVGLLTFLERLARRVELVNYGIYRSHPVDAERVRNTRDLLTDLRIPIKRRLVTNGAKAEVKPLAGEPSSGFQVVLGDKVIFVPAARDDQPSEASAQAAATRINKALDAGLSMFEVRADQEAGAVIARNQVLLQFSPADAKLMSTTPGEATKTAAAAIRNVIWREMVDTIH